MTEKPGIDREAKEDREARENRRAREAREGGPPVKEDPMGEREGEKEGEKEEKGSAVGVMWNADEQGGPPVKEVLL